VAHSDGEQAPSVQLIDARAIEVPDEEALREYARRLSADAGAPSASRSYCFPFALIASHTAAVGVDIERVERCDRAFADSIRTPAELAAGWPREGDPDRFFTSLWSSKEALSKGPGSWPDGSSGPWRASSLDVGEGGHVAWLCWRAEDS
jgi:hypothetical protein